MYYSDLVPVLIKATQEQQEIIEKLTQRIEELENSITYENKTCTINDFDCFIYFLWIFSNHPKI